MPDINLRSILLAGVVVGGAVVGVTIGAVMWLGPHVWAWLKPILHSATA